MRYTFDDIERLEGLLQAECQGLDFDPLATFTTARRLAVLCPDIAFTMNRVALRMLAEHRDHMEDQAHGPELVAC